MSSVAQIPFDAFRIIDLGQSFGLAAYQSLYKDHSEPIGLISVVQALGQLRPSDQAIEAFNHKWSKGSTRWKIRETGVEIVSGKSTTTGEMAKTRDGEAALLVLSFLIEMLGAKTTSDVARQIIDKTPSKLIPFRPRKVQVTNVVSAIESQTACVSWHDDIINAQQCVCERPVVWMGDTILPTESFDLPLECIQALYHALCAVSRFPTDFHCVLKTPLSLTLAFALAQSVCGLRVCVVVNGEVVHGSPVSGQWQVKLERYNDGLGTSKKTEVKLGRKLEDPQDLWVFDEVGPLRANRISIHGIARAATTGQGLGTSESNELAALAIGAATSIMGRWQRELVDESGDGDATDVSLSSSETSSSTGNMNDANNKSHLVPVKTRVTIEAIATWWGCSTKSATEMLNLGRAIFTKQPEDASWMQLHFCGTILGKIAEFEDLDDSQKMERRSQSNHAMNQRDFARLAHVLTTQLILITLLRGNTSAKDQVRVRSTCLPQSSELGRAIKVLNRVEHLRQSDVLYSWYFWLRGKPPQMPETAYGIEVSTTEGYLVYRSLLVDLNLSPESCEMVMVEPGHICSDNEKFTEIRGLDNGYTVDEEPYYRQRLEGKAKLRSQDHTGRLEVGWNVEEGDHSLDLEMWLGRKASGLHIATSIYQIAKMSWGLQYGDKLLGCSHDEDRVGALVDGEQIEVVSAGALRVWPSAPKPLLLLSAHGNDWGQIACLLSAPENSRGMVRVEACLRCCVTECYKKGLDFLID